ETCQKHLTEVLRAERPRRLLEAIQQGLSRKSEEGGKVARDEGTEPSPRPGELQLDCQVCPTTGMKRRSVGPAAGARAYLEAPPPGIVLCANRLGSRQEVEEAVVHELVHAYDYLVAGLALVDCQSLAEVRAARAAECSETSRSFVCSYFKKGCVRSTAARSTEGLFPGKGKGCVDAVFDAAYQDQGPYAPP
ncbi:unnamed protein product, partial [Scytosiphon promiscuus]